MTVIGESIQQSTRKEIQLVIAASSLGTVFEWYDFFIYGTLATLIGKLFFPAASATAGFLLALATFGVGFAVRPLGAVVFGILGDRLGRKYTFLVTISLMGAATAAIGFLPTYATIGVSAPLLLVLLRAMQGFAVGGEYGGASIYVAEHSPANRRGYFTSFTQIGAAAGLCLSLAVSLVTVWSIGEDAWSSWGWRIPFVVSLLLLAISVWMRLKLAESPVFKAMKEAGTIARNPLKESFSSWPKVKRILAALFGICAGQTVIGYTAFFQSQYFLQNTLHVDATLVRLIVLTAAATAIGWGVLFGWLSDQVGRKKPIVIGYLLTLLLLFPLFHFIADQANPALSDTVTRHPVVVSGSNCSYNPFAPHGQATACGRLMDVLTKRGIPYATVDGNARTAPFVTIGGSPVDASNAESLEAQLKSAGYRLDTVRPPRQRVALIILALTAVYALAQMAYAPVAAWLVELFPARVRYTSMSIPYHFGSGYAGGFLPFISQYTVVKTGNAFAGFWYAISVVILALFITIFALPETSGKDLD
jgi:MFS family permease